MTQKEINEINKELDRLTDLWELYGYRVFERALREQIKPIKELLRESKNVNYSNMVYSAYLSQQPIADALRKFYEKVGMAAATAEYNYIKRFTEATELLGIEFYSTAWRRSILEYFMTVGAQHVTDITDTTKKRIQRAFTETIEKGQGWQKAIKRINDYTLGELSGGRLQPRARARLIARTETLMISNKAYSEAQETMPYVMDKRWIHNPSPFERDWHRVLNGKEVEQAERFNVGGIMMLYPGDPAGGANNNCNCKCRHIMIPKEDEDGNLILKSA